MSARKLALLRDFFALLDRNGLSWCVVGDHRALHEHVASDVDIVVGRPDVRRAGALVKSFARQAGIWLVQDIQHEIVARYFVYAWIGERGEVEFLHVDICGDWYRNGRRFLDAAFLLRDRIGQHRRLADGSVMSFHVPRQDRSFLYYLLKKIDKAAVSDDQCAFLSSEFAAAGVVSDLNGFFGEESCVTIERAARSGDWSRVHARIAQLRGELRSSPRIGRRRWISEAARGALRLTRPTGVLIVFIGSCADVFDQVARHVATTWIKAFRDYRVVNADEGFGRTWRDVVHSSAVVVRSRLAPRWSPGTAVLVVDDRDGRDLRRFDQRMSSFLRERLSERGLGVFLP